jgi:hypothetical protein
MAKHLSHTIRIQNVFKQGTALLTLIFNFQVHH